MCHVTNDALEQSASFFEFSHANSQFADPNRQLTCTPSSISFTCRHITHLKARRWILPASPRDLPLTIHSTSARSSKTAARTGSVRRFDFTISVSHPETDTGCTWTDSTQLLRPPGRARRIHKGQAERPRLLLRQLERWAGMDRPRQPRSILPLAHHPAHARRHEHQRPHKSVRHTFDAGTGNFADPLHATLSAELFGHRIPAPILFAPIGINKLYYPTGELVPAKIAGELGLPVKATSRTLIAGF